MLRHCISKTILHSFMHPPQLPLQNFTVGQVEISFKFSSLCILYLCTRRRHIFKFHATPMPLHCPFQNYISLFHKPILTLFTAHESWPGTRKYSKQTCLTVKYRFMSFKIQCLLYITENKYR